MKWTSKQGGTTFKNPEPGTYSATCYKLIDQGTQQAEWKGEIKHAHKVMIGWEINELMEDGKPFVVNRVFTVSMHEKATLRKFLAGWRGRDFNEEELMGFEAKNLIGKHCMLSLVQNGEYVNIDTASKLPKGMEPHKLVNPPVFFDLSAFDKRVYESLSDKMKEKIANSPEYKAAIKGGHFDDMADDIPDSEEAF